MNERLLELAEQAWDATAVSPDFGHPVTFAEKFAQLIVKECAEVVDSDDSAYPYDSFGHKLKQHFGVE